MTSARFYHIFMMMFFGVFFGLYMQSAYKAVNQDNMSDHLLTVAGTVGSLCNGFSRVFWGTMQDWFGFRRTMSVLLCI